MPTHEHIFSLQLQGSSQENNQTWAKVRSADHSPLYPESSSSTQFMPYKSKFSTILSLPSILYSMVSL